MRLTIFHNENPHPLWENSLKKLITPLTFNELTATGDVHIAVFNDGVVGISLSKDDSITYLKVRDITRRRGVGKYLLEETINFIAKDFDKAFIDTSKFPQEEQDGLIYFLEMEGFVKENDNSSIYVYEVV